ncbi:MAG TPA: hypothetical protein VEQ16_03455 [Acidocella sp.]|nr:hypothetical protein [Acidocella sp.]
MLAHPVILLTVDPVAATVEEFIRAHSLARPARLAGARTSVRLVGL